MLKETKKLETNRYQLEIVVDGEKFREAIKEAYHRNGSKINVPGFRKGKAPLNMVETYYGVEVFFEDALNIIYPEVVEEAIKESGLNTIEDRLLAGGAAGDDPLHLGDAELLAQGAGVVNVTLQTGNADGIHVGTVLEHL